MTKKTSNHSRKKASIASVNTDKVSNKIMIGSKSATKLSRGISRPDSAFGGANKESRQSLNALAPEAKYLTKPTNRKMYEPPSYIMRKNPSNTLSTPTNYSKENSFKTSGILTARTVVKPIPEADLKSIKEHRQPRITYKKLRTKSRGEVIANKESSSNSSKISAKCPSSLSKSNSRRKEKIGSTKHQKKKSAAIPTRTTKALYSNKSEYDKKRNSKAVISSMKPSSSASNIEPKSSRIVYSSKLDSKIKYPTYDKQSKDASYQGKREHYNVIKSSREPRRLIEFKLHDDDDESSATSKLEELKNRSKDYKTKYYMPISKEIKSAGLSNRLNSHKSETKLDTIKSKYGSSSIAHTYKPKNTSVSSLNSSKKR